ncbi:lipoprotein HlpB [Actinobacillus porcitonsillarum]|uniref:Lipoprotein HlpB n=1 Tax=Actinobacillus porcitonsillarum TaxID=189834 RepID=A0A2U8FJJ7_9PAST|nr:lipoprotein HlpB [Actinobacillus porcitonsillarum]AWI51180.1 lipoprotein HlpB [Actinobacillus porcitonsillarum]
MTKFTKISATALFALFLTACDKPANKPAEAAKPAETTPATQPATEAQKAETTAPVTQLSAEELAQGKADFKKILDWNKTQEQIANAAQKTLQEKLASQDPKQIETALTEFTKTVEDTIKSLDAVEVKNALVKTFKEKTKEVLGLSNTIVADSVKVMANPTAEAQESLKAKTQQLLSQGGELQKLQAELQQTFGDK